MKTKNAQFNHDAHCDDCLGLKKPINFNFGFVPESKKMKEVYERNRRPIRWADREFESMTVASLHLRVSMAKLLRAVREKREINGHVPERVK